MRQPGWASVLGQPVRHQVFSVVAFSYVKLTCKSTVCPQWCSWASSNQPKVSENALSSQRKGAPPPSVHTPLVLLLWKPPTTNISGPKSRFRGTAFSAAVILNKTNIHLAKTETRAPGSLRAAVLQFSHIPHTQQWHSPVTSSRF